MHGGFSYNTLLNSVAMLPVVSGEFRQLVSHLSHRAPVASPDSLKGWPAGG